MYVLVFCGDVVEESRIGQCSKPATECLCEKLDLPTLT
jgi:hypothetical protein